VQAEVLRLGKVRKDLMWVERILGNFIRFQFITLGGGTDLARIFVLEVGLIVTGRTTLKLTHRQVKEGIRMKHAYVELSHILASN